MNRAFFPKAALLLVFILLLATPMAQAAGRGAHSRPVSLLQGLFDQAWEFLTRIWADNGCGLDPDGRCIPAPKATAEADNGCGIDPNGGCIPAQNATAEADNGCGLDPSGGCAN
jgi:hypothetical protein